MSDIGFTLAFNILVFITIAITILVAKHKSAYNNNSSYIGDTSFVLFKMGIVVTFIAFTYWCTVLLGTMPFYQKLYYSGKFPLIGKITWILIFIWLLLALSIIPFNHTIIKKNSNDEKDENATSILNTMYSFFYKFPLTLIFTVMVIYYIIFCFSMDFKDKNTWIFGGTNIVGIAKSLEGPGFKIGENFGQVNVN